MDIYQEIIEKYPPASQNNARSIVRSAVDRAVKRKSMSMFQEVESDYGFPFDFSPADYGEEPKQLQDN